METKEKKSRREIVIANGVFLISTLIVFYILQTIVPFIMDDEWAIGNMRKMSAQDKALEVFRFPWFIYFHGPNGRLLSVAVSVLFVLNESIMNILSSLFFVTFSILTVHYLRQIFDSDLSGNSRKSRSFDLSSLLLYPLIVLFIIFISPEHQILPYWASGFSNYILAAWLTVIYLVVLEWSLQNDFSKLTFVALIVFSSLSGLSHEIFSLPVAAALGILAVINFKKLSVQTKWIIAAFLIGSFLLFVSPGSWNRFEGMHGTGEPIVHRLLTSFKAFGQGKMLWLAMAMMIYLWTKKRHRLSFFKQNFNLQLLVLSLLFSIIELAIIGTGGRSLWGIEFFSLLIILYCIVSNWCLSEKKSFAIGLSLSAIVLFSMIALVPAMSEEWGNFKDARKEALTSGKATVPMRHLEHNSLMKPLIPNLYTSVRDDMFFNLPNANVLNTEIYNRLYTQSDEDYRNWNLPIEIENEWIVPYSQDILDAIKDDKLRFLYSPISLEMEGSSLTLLWHQICQNYFPDRYPTEQCVGEDDIEILEINARKYLRFKHRFAPIPRKIVGILRE